MRVLAEQKLANLNMCSKFQTGFKNRRNIADRKVRPINFLQGLPLNDE